MKQKLCIICGTKDKGNNKLVCKTCLITHPEEMIKRHIRYYNLTGRRLTVKLLKEAIDNARQ